MSALHALSNRQHLLMTALAVTALAAVIVLLFAATSTATASILSVLIIVAALALRAMMTARATPRAARARPQPASDSAAPPLLLTLASGEVLVAREVDLGHPGEHRLLLTRKGYMLINAAGEVIYQL